VDTKTVGKEGRTLRGPSVSSDHLPRSGSQQREWRLYQTKKELRACAVGGGALGVGAVFAWLSMIRMRRRNLRTDGTTPYWKA